ncbi:hypothetical protein CDD80_5389 [Ophiocordyceps camponoti-rufipedis]|uniref:Uncharacterized protein n=1 Tax=Ophiocordyceps camponoti-rufipedis TaxID=2004952 RepID=A0A2C5ZHL3_9HYPO|nr:hypothetical protein CDD80_5389 [Ophiocordyceps camponoti-rufipedis]
MRYDSRQEGRWKSVFLIQSEYGEVHAGWALNDGGGSLIRPVSRTAAELGVGSAGVFVPDGRCELRCYEASVTPRAGEEWEEEDGRERASQQASQQAAQQAAQQAINKDPWHDLELAPRH